MLERFLELLERIHMLDCGGERSISYQVAQLLVNLLDFCAGCVAYPIDEPESMQAETTVDKVFGRNGREMPALQVVALVNYTVASKLADLFGGFFPADDVQRFDSCELRELNDVLSHG